MPLHDTSHIPDDEAYYSSLSERVTRAALARRRNLVYWLGGSRRAWIAAASLIAVVALGWALNGRPGNGGAIFLDVPQSPPSLGALLFFSSAQP